MRDLLQNLQPFSGQETNIQNILKALAFTSNHMSERDEQEVITTPPS